MTTDSQYKYTPEQVLKAIRGTRGIIPAAAEALGCHRSTVYEYLKRHPEIGIELENERETMLDHVEAVAYDVAVKDRNPRMIMYLLNCLGRHRGFGERGERTEREDYSTLGRDDTDTDAEPYDDDDLTDIAGILAECGAIVTTPPSDTDPAPE